MTTSRRNTIMLWMAYTEFFYPGCELQPGYFYLSIPELYYIPEDGACIGAAGVDAYSKAPPVQKDQGRFASFRKQEFRFSYSSQTGSAVRAVQSSTRDFLLRRSQS